jgi:hypothetical protein
MRSAVASSLAVAFGIFAFTAGFGLTGSRAAAAGIAAAAAGLVAWRVGRRRGLALDEAAAPRALRIVSALATGAALVQLARLAVFHVAPAETGYSWAPGSDWETRHACISAYFEAAALAESVPNVYDEALYSAPDDDPARPRKARMMDGFSVDTYEYPPPFLLLPRVLRLLTPEFLAFRSLWFGLTGAAVLAVLMVLAGFLGPATGTRALLLSPLAFVALPTLSAIQKGNFQILTVAASMLAMVLFERRRFAAGGALLAFVTVSKLFPGLLGVYLLARRQWRAAAWSAGFGVLFAVATLIDLGWIPYRAFLDHVPGLLSGESFPAFRNPAARAINFSVPGLVFKLGLFGVPGMSFGAAKIVGWIYTLVVTVAVWVVGRRTFRQGDLPMVWMAILILATLRSPFLPQSYAAFPPLLLLVLLAARRVPTARSLAAVLAAWAVLNFLWPLDWPIDPRLLAVLNLVPQSLAIGLAAYALRRPRSAAADGEPEEPALQRAAPEAAAGS